MNDRLAALDTMAAAWTTTDPRQASEVVADFAACARRLATMAADWQQGQFRKADTTTAANSIEGMRALLAELRTNSQGEKS